MTVKELIDNLEEYPSDMKVIVDFNEIDPDNQFAEVDNLSTRTVVGGDYSDVEEYLILELA